MTKHRGVDPLRAATSTLDFSWVKEPARSVADASQRLGSQLAPDALCSLLTWLALRADEDSHALLRSALARADIRRSLDPTNEARASYLDLRLSWIVSALASNPGAVSRASLDALSRQSFVAQEVLPQQLLIRAFAAQRPPSDHALQFWRQQAAPNSLTAADVLVATALNETATALALWSEIWRDPGHASELRIAWMRQIVFPLRQREQILLSIERLLPLLDSKDLQKAMVEVVLANKDRWSLPDTEVVEAPGKISAAAKVAKRRIARWAADHLEM